MEIRFFLSMGIHLGSGRQNQTISPFKTSSSLLWTLYSFSPVAIPSFTKRRENYSFFGKNASFEEIEWKRTEENFTSLVVFLGVMGGS